MAVKEILQRFRDRGYGSSDRVLDLTPEELSSLPRESGEICVSVYGTVTDKGFKVSRVEPEREEAPKEPAEGPPNRAMPSPS